MNVVAYGGGTNSTAMLVGMYEKGIPVDLILFADPGSEQPYTYEYLPIMDGWLARHGMPHIQVVYCTDKNGDRLTLEQECLRSGTLPAIAYGYKKCSLKHKIGPQEKFCNNYPPCREVWARGEKVVKFIGYDVGEANRRENVREHDEADPKYIKVYPLMDWGWTREDCVAAIQRAGLPLPGKSSCFFCPSMKKREIRTLYHRHRDLYERAIAIEDGARPSLVTVKGLARNWAWRDFVAADLNQQAMCWMFPEDADLFCTVDYGASEGVYVDVYLKWYDEEQGKDVTERFITGKTLGANGNDLDRMFLTASAITKAVHGNHATHSRYMKIDGVEDDVGGRVVHLSQQEEKAIIQALVEQRERQEEAMGRPGAVGRQMTRALLDDVERFPEPAYATACRKAIDINDPQKVKSLLVNAADRVAELSPSFHGQMAVYAFLDHCYISREIIKQCSDEQIAAAPPRLLELFAAGPDYEMLSTLVEKGISGGGSAARTLHMLTYEGRNSWMAEELLEKRMWVDPNDYGVLYACMENGAELRWGPHKADLWLCGERRHSGMSEPRRKRRGEGYAACADAAKLLLDGGTDLDQYKEWATRQSHGLRCDDTLASLEVHWAELQAQAQESAEQEQAHESAGPEIGGMDLG